jgi:KAP family P-loop domain
MQEYLVLTFLFFWFMSSLTSNSSDQSVIHYNQLKSKDKLDRVPLIQNLTKMVQNIPSPFVLSINASWGMGKTTLLKLWKAYLEQSTQGFRCIYFSAWENDFTDEPITALLSEIKSEVDKVEADGKTDLTEGFDELVKKGQRIALRSVSTLLKVAVRIATKNALSAEELKDIFKDDEKMKDSIAGDIGDFAKSEVQSYLDKKQAMTDFQSQLKDFVKFFAAYQMPVSEQPKPLVIFIDELDRCRPSYAIELMETVKHLFSVEGVVFVLGIDMEQLGKSASVLYGQAMNTEGYFRRLIDYEFVLPLPKIEILVKHLHSSIIQISSRSDFTPQQKKYFAEQENKIVGIICELAKEFALSMRDIENLYRRYQIVFLLQPKHLLNAYDFTLFWLVIKMKFSETYSDLLANLFKYPINTSNSLDAKDIFEVLNENKQIARFLQRPETYIREIALQIIDIAVSQNNLSLRQAREEAMKRGFSQHTHVEYRSEMPHSLKEVLDSIEFANSIK